MFSRASPGRVSLAVEDKRKKKKRRLKRATRSNPRESGTGHCRDSQFAMLDLPLQEFEGFRIEGKMECSEMFSRDVISWLMINRD